MPDKATLDPMRAATGVFPKKEHDWRVRRLTQAMAEAGIDEVLVYSWPWRPDNARYLAGAPVTGTTLFRLRGDGHVSALVSNEVDRAAIRRAGWVSDIDRASQFSPAVLRGWLDGVGAGSRLGVTQLELMPVGLRRNIEQAQPNVKLESATRLVDLVRFLKSAWEHERIRASVDLATRGWQAMFESMNPGVREFEVVAALEREIKRNGAEDNFMLIGSGTTGVRAMHAPEDRRLQLGDLVRTELTPQVDGYYAQICRTAVLGKPSREQSWAYEVFREAVEAGIDTVRPGATSHEVAKAQNDVLRANGLGEYCTTQHMRVRGHGVGLYIDEMPGVKEGDETVIQEGASMVIHPNTYTPMAGYMVVGDPILVTATGTERLATADTKLPSRTEVSS